jgi:hypothetical protein
MLLLTVLGATPSDGHADRAGRWMRLEGNRCNSGV